MRKYFLFIVLALASFNGIAQRQIINVGSSGNDHTGDPLRTAFQKTNANFLELYNAVFPYVNPVYTSFSITGLSQTGEVGITLSGAKTYTWGIALNSGTVSTIDIYDNTASATLLAGTANDGTQAQTITTIQLNSPGATQSWKGIGYNSSPAGTFNSANFVVTAKYKYFADAVSSSLTNSASVRALTVTGFENIGGQFNFTLNSGTSLHKFVLALSPGSTLVSVIDIDALNADITSAFIAQSNINVLDAGSTNRSYLIWEYNTSSPYASNHRLLVTYNN
jgi:hypothetical protein